MSSLLTFFVFAILLLTSDVFAWMVKPSSGSRLTAASTGGRTWTILGMTSKPASEKAYRVEIPLGDGFKDVAVTFRPLFAKSEFYVTSYNIPFSLNIEKPPKGFPAPVVTKDGKGGERVGDVLRATTCWSQGFSAAGAASDIMMFAGNVKWRKSIFDTTGKISWLCLEGSPFILIIIVVSSLYENRCALAGGR
jgi:hypothetical protein